MKWIARCRLKERENHKKTWHRYFAWFPVTIGKTPDGHKCKVWWDWVERKGLYMGCGWDEGYWAYKYRMIK